VADPVGAGPATWHRHQMGEEAVPDYSVAYFDDDDERCRCSVLERPVEPKDLRDLDHVPCVDTMVNTVTLYLVEQGRWESHAQCDPTKTLWPFRYPGGRWLMLVIRQWALEEESEFLARLLNKDHRWQAVVQALREHGDVDRIPERVLARMLSGNGLPATPPTVAHLRAVVCGHPEPPLPARGVLVTTLVFADVPANSHHPPGAWAFHDGNPDFVVSEGGEFTTPEIREAAAQIILETRKWLRTFKCLEIATRRARNRAIASTDRAAAEELSPERRAAWLDYETYALADENVEKIIDPIRAGGRPSDEIEKAIGRADATIGQRRRRAKVPRTPPRGWRDVVRRKLRQRLRDRGIEL
jgi:hypothetical protein